MSKLFKHIIISISFSVSIFFLIEQFGKTEYNFYTDKRCNTYGYNQYTDFPTWVEITLEEYNDLIIRNESLAVKDEIGCKVKREKKFNNTALYISIAIAIGIFTLTYKKAPAVHSVP